MDGRQHKPLRTTVAALLTMLLLCVSALTSSCETRCDLASDGSGCHVASTSLHGPAAMASMPGMEDHSASAIHRYACCERTEHHTCAQLPALTREQSIQNFISCGLRAMMSSPTPLCESADDASTAPDRGPPLFRPGTPVTLHTTLLL